MFKTRLLSGVILVALLIAFVVTGDVILFAGITLISLIGMRELYHVAGIEKSALGYVGYFVGIIFFLSLYAKIHLGRGDIRVGDRQVEITAVVMMVLVMAAMAVYVVSFPKYHANQVILCVFALPYVAMMLSYVYQTRMLPMGNVLVWLIFFSSWGCDTCAYCVGVLIGKHKLAPILSPKKSVEGAVGGVLGAALLGFLYALAVKYFGFGADAHPLFFGLICGIGAIISQVGDLAASGIKRNYELKDYGKLIPGHGGILDRFDSVIFTAPMIYYLSVLFF